MKRRFDISDTERFARRGALGFVPPRSIDRASQFVSGLPLPLVIGITIVLTLATMPLGLLVPVLAWLMWQRGALANAIDDAHGAGTEAAEDFHNKLNRVRHYPHERDHDEVLNPRPGGFVTPDEEPLRPRFGRKGGPG